MAFLKIRQLSLRNLFLISTIFLLSTPVAVTAISTSDLDLVLSVLRPNGHSLFANAIATSDILFDLLSIPSLTLLAPTDSAVFALDLSHAPPFYLTTLRLHALPFRLSVSHLRSLPNSSFLPTLLPSRSLRLTSFPSSLLRGSRVFAFDGVNVSSPGLYYAKGVALHGLAGILSFRSTDDNDHVERFASGSLPVPDDRTVVFQLPFSTPPGNRTHSKILPPDNRTVPSSPAVPIINDSPSNFKNSTSFFPSNDTDLSPSVNHTALPPALGLTASPADFTRSISLSPAPLVPPVHRTEAEDLSVVTSPPTSHSFLAPEPGPRCLDGHPLEKEQKIRTGAPQQIEPSKSKILVMRSLPISVSAEIPNEAADRR